MSLQDETVENVPDPTCEKNDIANSTVGAETRLDMIKSWINTCNQHHDSPCVIPKAEATAWPAWLIDTVNACIVEGEIADRYLTLSYVWGGVQTVQLSSSNIGLLRQQGSLIEVESTLPRTIREALQVTRLLEEQYIFVDQLCIVQDDQQHKKVEIENMAEIYANSYLTLVATTGATADFGLVDRPDQWIHQSLRSVNWPKHKRYHEMRYLGLRQTWSFRGWTHQERNNAGRILYFFKFVKENIECGEKHDPDLVSWACHRTQWLDKKGILTTGSNQHPIATEELLPGPTTWPDFEKYAAEVRDYIPRHFTYDSDVVPAFAGTAASFAKVFPGGFLFGLPVLFFDLALLWTFHEVAARRIGSADLEESTGPPSWSWMTWRGNLSVPIFWWGNTRSLIKRQDGDAGIVICPLVQWYYSGTGGARIAVKNEYHKYIHFARDSESIPPLGWSRTTPSSSKYSSDLHRNYDYETPAAPGLKFRFPIPLVDTSHTPITLPMPISNIITCQTERAYFHVAWQGKGVNDGLGETVEIYDVEGSVVGRMWRSGDAPVPTTVDIRVELIAISTGLAGNRNECYERLYRGKPYTENGDDDGVREFYNLLWIEWTDGIAYRKAVGQFDKETWETADRELIEVKLG